MIRFLISGLFTACCLQLTAQNVPDYYPDWWVSFNVVDPDGDHTNNQAVVNQGQTKHVVSQAITYLDVLLEPMGGAGFTLEEFLDPAKTPDHYAPLLMGQLKHLSKPFYDRFRTLGFTPEAPGWPASLILTEESGDQAPLYPWKETTTPLNFQPALIGQLKHLFSWDLDKDGDLLPDFWEQEIIDANSSDGIDEITDVLPTDDFDADGHSNAEEYQDQTDPTLFDGSWMIVAGFDQSGVFLETSAAFGSGQNRHGQVQLGSGANLTSWGPHQISDGVQTLVYGATHTLALLTSGEVLGWGDNFYGQLDFNTGSIADQIAAGNGFTLLLTRSTDTSPSTLKVFGDDRFGMFAGQTGPDVSIAFADGGGQVNLFEITAGPQHGLAVDVSGDVWAWGANDAGQCGSVDSWETVLPHRITFPLPVVRAAAGARHSLALTSAGALYGWGSDDFGQLGGLPGHESQMPVVTAQLLFANGVTHVDAGAEFTVVATATGDLWYAGRKSDGTLTQGFEKVNNTSFTKAIVGMNAGRDHVVVLFDDDTLLTFGRNLEGQLAVGSSIPTETPFSTQSPSLPELP